MSTEEINEAEIRILKILQSARFSDEINKLKSKSKLNKSKFISLSLFLDENSLIRVRERLQKSVYEINVLAKTSNLASESILFNGPNYTRDSRNLSSH